MNGNQEDVVRKVQALWRQADHPNTSPEERAVFVAKARELMAKNAIDEIVLSEASETGEAIVIAEIFVGQVNANNEYLTSELVPVQRMELAHYIAMHHRLRSIIITHAASIDEDGEPLPSGKYLQLIGFRSDVQMTRLLNQALAADMLIAMSTDIDIIKATGHMTPAEKRNYLMSFCEGYAMRIEERLAEVDTRVEQMASEGSLLPVLVNRKDAVNKYVDDMYGDLRPERVKAFHFDNNAASRGRAAANKASLGQKGVGGRRGELT